MTKYTKANPEDLAELIVMLDETFVMDDGSVTDFANLDPKFYGKNATSAPSHYIIRDDGKIKSAVGAFSNSLTVGTETLNVRGIGSVSVHRTARSKGYMKLLMNAAVDDMKADKIDFGFLSGLRQRYEYFSFTPTGSIANFLFTSDNSKHLFGIKWERTYDFVEVKACDSDFLHKILQLYNKKSVRADRPIEQLHDIMMAWKYRPYAVLIDGEFAGYILVSENKKLICEAEFYDVEIFPEVLASYLKKFETDSVTATHITMCEREKLRILSNCAEHFELTTSECMAIFNFRNVIYAFLKLKSSYEVLADGELLVDIKDHETIKITVKNNEVSVENTDEKAQIQLPYFTAIHIFFSPTGFLTDFGFKLPICAKTWFPLPLFYSKVDGV